MRAKGFQLRAEQQRLAEPAIVQRLFARPVAHEVQGVLRPVPQREGEHAVEPLQRGLDGPLGNGREQHFGVGAAPKRVPVVGQFVA